MKGVVSPSIGANWSFLFVGNRIFFPVNHYFTLLSFMGLSCGSGAPGAFLVPQMAKNLPTMWETWVLSLGWEDPLEEGMATHSSILAWRIPWTEEPGRLQSIGSHRVRHNWSDLACWTILSFKPGCAFWGSGYFCFLNIPSQGLAWCLSLYLQSASIASF